MPFVEIGPSRIRYDSFGEGPALVFAHGVGGNRASWFKQTPRFSRDRRVIVFDHRAFGGSTDIEQAGRTRYVDDLLTLLDALEIDRAVLVGQSMGGGTCAAFACRHPDRVNGLVVADSLAGITVAEPLAEALRITREANGRLSQVERVLGPTMRASDPESTLLYLMLASFNSVTAATVRGTMPPWSPGELAATGIPTMFIVGEHDVLFPPAHIEAVHRMITGSRFTTIPDAGHSAYFERPEAFNAVLDAFLASLGAIS